VAEEGAVIEFRERGDLDSESIHGDRGIMKQDKISAHSWQADLALLGVTLIWGATFVMVKNAVAHFPVFAFLTLRFSFALLSLAPFLWVRRLKRPRDTAGPDRAGLRAGSLVGLALLAGYGLQTAGLRHTTAAKAGFITGLSVVFVPALGAILWRRRPSRGAQVGAFLATVGLALLTLGPGLSIAWGDIIVLGCAVGFALHILAVGAFAPQVEPGQLTAIQIGTVALLSALISAATERPWPSLRPQVVWAALFTGVLATSLAFGVQSVAQRFTSATHTALIFAMEPVFAALFAYLLAQEQLASRHWAGCALILSGMLVAELGIPLSTLWHRTGRMDTLFEDNLCSGLRRRKKRHEVAG
jgi:drug/metabolite transporter (DMT)-like permease